MTTDYVYDTDGSLPDGKSDLRPLTAPAQKSFVAAEWNKVLAAVKSSRAALLAGRFLGLEHNPTAAVGTSTQALMRSRNGAFEVSEGGRGFRGVAPGLSPFAFGVKGDNSTDDTTAMQAAIDAAAAADLPLCVPGGDYVFTRPLHLTAATVIRGTVGRSTNPKVRFHFPTGCPGLIVHQNTSPVAGYGATSSISNIAFIATTGSAATGILAYSRFKCAGCYFKGWTKGIYIHGGHSVTRLSVTSKTGWMTGSFSASGGASGTVEADSAQTGSTDLYVFIPSGSVGIGETVTVGGQTAVVSAVAGPFLTNANAWRLDDVWADTCVTAIHVDGGDANAGCAFRCEVQSCDLAFWDHSFLGNSWIQCVTEANTQGFKFDLPTQSGQLIGCYSENSAVEEVQYPNMIFGGSWGTGWKGVGAYQAAVGFENSVARHALNFGAIPGSLNGFAVGSDTTDGAILAAVDLYAGRSYLRLGTGSSDSARLGGKNAYYWNYENSASTAYAVTSSHGEVEAYDGGIGQRSFESDAGVFAVPLYFYLRGRRHDVDRLSNALTFRGTWLEGSKLFTSYPTPGDYVGFVVTSPGTTGTYSEGVTATANGTTSLTLSAAPAFLRKGEYVTINGVATKIVSIVGTTMTTANSVTAGSALAITYTAPVFKAFGRIAGETADSTASAGAATQHTLSGRVAIAAGASSVVVTNNKVTTTSKVFAQLQTIDGTLTTIKAVVPGSGSFTITGNANATGNVKVAWRLEE